MSAPNAISVRQTSVLPSASTSRWISDAKIILEKKLDLITDAIYEIEKPTEFSK
jgi:hypothetical protein